MARRLGCRAPVITRIESGQHATLESTVVRYATALGLVPALAMNEPAERPATEEHGS